MKRRRTFSLFTNPELWARVDIAAPAKEERDVYFEFDVSEEKVDTISLPADFKIDCDAANGILVFDFATGEREATWARIADGVLVSITEGRALKSILFGEVGL